MLIIFSGLPGVGKSSIAKELAKKTKAVYVRIDTIEHAIKRSNILKDDMAACGYNVAYGLASDNLSIGNAVIADSVNPIKQTRDAWFSIGQNGNARIFEIEVICSDQEEHRRRIESREADLAHFKLPVWQDVVDRHYEEWDRPRMIVDTAQLAIEDSVMLIMQEIK